MIERCGDCRFMRETTRDGRGCHLKPPPFPYVSANDWCGEFQPKEKDYGYEAEEACEADAEAAPEPVLGYEIRYDDLDDCWRIYSRNNSVMSGLTIGGEFEFKPQAEDWLRRYIGIHDRKLPRW